MRVRPPQLSASLPWLNVSDPLSLRDLKGHAVLLKFWTQGCINCQHMMPVMHQLQQHYGSKLIIIGIHSAKFEAEQSSQSVQQAIEQYDITHPVVVDEGLMLWQAYAVRAWPTLVFIDPKGYIVRQISGERSFDQIKRLLNPLIDPSTDTASINDVALPPAPSCAAPNRTLRFPGKILAADSRLFIADTGQHRIVVTDLTGQIQHIVGTGTANLQDGSFQNAQFKHPQGMTWNVETQTLYVADAGNHAIRQISLIEAQVKTLAGNGNQSRAIFPHGGAGTELSLNSPWDLAQVGQQIYIAMAGIHQIWKMDLNTRQLETYIGTGAEGCVDGDRAVAAFAQPSGLDTDGHYLYVADSETSSIRRVRLGPNPIAETLCGSGALFDYGDQDGEGDTVRLQHPMDVTVKSTEMLLISDTYNNKIKQLSLSTRRCETVTKGFQRPSSITYQANNLYVTDASEQPIKVIRAFQNSAEQTPGQVNLFRIL